MNTTNLYWLSARERYDGFLVLRIGPVMQYVLICYTVRLTEAGVELTVGAVSVSYTNALAESVMGLYETEVIRRRDGPWCQLGAGEFATMEWIHWYDNRHLLTPAEYGSASYQQREESAMAVLHKRNSLRENRCGSRHE